MILTYFISSTSPYPSPAHYHDKQKLLHHQQRVGSHPQIRGETALSRLQQRVSQGDVQSLVVQPPVQSVKPEFESPVMARIAHQQSESSSPAKMRWKNLKHQTGDKFADAARAVRDELTNTSSTVIDMGTGGDEPEGNGSTSVVSTTGQPKRSVRRPRRPPTTMGPQLVRRKYTLLLIINFSYVNTHNSPNDKALFYKTYFCMP